MHQHPRREKMRNPACCGTAAMMEKLLRHSTCWGVCRRATSATVTTRCAGARTAASRLLSGGAALALHGGTPVVNPKDPLPTIANHTGRSIGDSEKLAIMDVLDRGNLAYITGSKVKEFQQAFGEIYGTTNNVAVSSGTSALHTALVYLNPEPGDEILVSPITDMGDIIAILMQMCVPVFVDVDAETQNLDPAKIEAAITARTKAVIATHIYGASADMDPIMEVAQQHSLFVIEDCAQAVLSTYKGRLCGTIGHMGCFSFQQSKHITTGDGGMVISNSDEQFGRKLNQCHDKGWPRDGVATV